MHILALLAGAIGLIAFWLYRAQAAKASAEDIVDAANSMRLAARRYGFRRRANVHPSEGIEDARLAAAGVMIAFAEMDGALSEMEIETAIDEAERRFNITRREAEEVISFGRWIASQSPPEESARRLGRKVATLAGPEGRDDTVAMVKAVLTSDGSAIDEHTRFAIDRLSRAFGG